MVIFSLLYGIISFTFSYYGEMVTYLGMTMPMAIFALISWLRNPYNGNKAEVKVNVIKKKEISYMWAGALLITILFYYILKYFDTANIIPSTLSVTTSFVSFLANDIYGFINWQRMKKRQGKNTLVVQKM